MEHRTDTETHTQGHFTRSREQQSQNVFNKSAVTDHCVLNNHVIDWDNTKILDHDNKRETRWIRESVYIRQAGKFAMNRDFGQYMLPNTYDPVLRRIPKGGADLRHPPKSTHQSTPFH